MAFNFGNNQFQGRGQSQGRQMQGIGQQGFGPRPNAPFRGQPFMQQQQPQGFQGGFGGYQVGHPMGPFPGAANMGRGITPFLGTPNAGQAMAPSGMANAGQTMPNMQAQQHQFMMLQQQQQKKAMEQQRKQAEENQKKQEELRRRHNFEMQQRKLQSQKKGTASHVEVSNLFGKKEKGTASAAMNLIGSLGMEPASKGATKHAPVSSVFSRPGSSYHSNGPNPHTALYGIEFMSQGSPGRAPPILDASGTDDFGDFAQGPSAPGPDTAADEFNNFLEARSIIGPGIQGPSSGVAPSGIAGQGSFRQSHSWSMPAQSTDVSASNFPNSPSTGPNVGQFSGAIATQNNPMSLSNPTQSNSGSFNVGMTMPGVFEMAGSFGVLKSRSSSVSSQESLGRVSSGSSSFGAPVSGNTAAHSSGFVPGGGFDTGNVMPALGDMDSVEAEPAPEKTAAEKLQVLYGTQLPDWCINGTDLPSVYHDVTSRTTGGLDTIDTGELYHVLLSSDVSRDKLGMMWNQVNRANPGQLNVLELRLILGLVALAQAGIKAERLTLQKLASCKAAPIPSFPEDVLEAKGRGWSFMEQQAEETTVSSNTDVDNSNVIENQDRYSAFSETAQAGPTGFLVSSSSSLVPTDPNDRYSVFRTVELPGASNNQEDWSEMTEFQGAGAGANGAGRTEVGDVGRILQQLKQQQQQQQQQLLQPLKLHREQPAEAPKENIEEEDDFGDFESVPIPPPVSQSSLNNATSSGDDFGDFQLNLVPSILKGSQDLAGNDSADVPKPLQGSTGLAKSLQDFALKNTTPSNVLSNTATTPSLFSLEPPTPVSSSSKPLEESLTIAKDPTTLKKAKDSVTDEPFGSFLGTSTSNLARGITKQPAERESQNSSGDADDKYSVFKALDISSETSVFGNRSAEKPAVDDDFGDFAGPQFISEVPPPMEDDFGDFQFTDKPDETQVQPDSWQSNMAVLCTEISNSQPVNRTVGILGSRSTEKPVVDDDFGDFAGPELIRESPPPMEDDFQFTDKPAEKNVLPNPWQSNLPVWSTESSNSQPSALMASDGQTSSNETAEKVDNSKSNFQADFGDFQSLTEVKPDSSCDLTSLSSEGSKSQALPKGGSNGDFASFGSFKASSKSDSSTDRPHSVSVSSLALINSVPLELSQRYNLSKQFEDFDQHASAWCRCLNSCLLTLATASLAIQKMKEASLRQEILQSKEGSLYFSSIAEVYRVTRRIRASVEKTASNNIKLKNILDEVESTWKSIANFLTGSETLPSQSSLDLSRLHVTSQDDRSGACGVCLLNVEKTVPGATKQADGKLKYGGRQYHTTCANFWCNRVDSVLPTLLPVYSLI